MYELSRKKHADLSRRFVSMEVNMLKTFDLKKYKVNKEAGESPLQVKTKKLLAGFIAVMSLLTLLSKAADSITIAQVKVLNPKGGMLTYEAEGEGIITADARKYVRAPEDIIIDSINVKPGQEIKEGAVLFTLNQSGIEAALETADRDIDKLYNQIAQEKLSPSDSYQSQKSVKELSLNYAREDLTNAKANYRQTEKACSEAKLEASEAENKYKKALAKSAAEMYEQKKQEYADAKASFDNISLADEGALITASRAYDNANDALQELEKDDLIVLEYLDQYCIFYNTSWDLKQEAQEGLLSLAYGDEDAYRKHLENVYGLQKKLTRATEDYFSAQNEYEKHTSAEEDGTGYLNAVITAKRALKDAEDSLSAENERENVIISELNLYLSAKTSSNTDGMNSALLEIYKCIYGISGYKKHKNDITKAQINVNQALEDITSLQKKNEISLAIEQGKLDKIKKVIASIENGSYDNETAAQTEKQTAEAAKQAFKTQEQAVEEAKKAIEAAARSLQSALLDYKLAIEQDGKNTENTLVQKKAADLRISVLQLDLEEKQQTVNHLIDLKENKGKITSPVSGTIDSIAIEAGKKAAADQNITINTGKYGITVTVSKEQGEYIAIGDNMELIQKGKNEIITVAVEGLRFATDQQNNEIAEITAMMPDGNYITGTAYDAKSAKNSVLYDLCLPLSAIRSDSNGKYCLTTQARNTVLGKELIAVRVPLTIIDKDLENAAVSGAIINTDDVIITSSKNIAQGDRVRINQ